MKVTNLNQTAQIDTNLNCAFSQKNISNLSNKIVNQISKTINNLYKAIATKPDPKKYEFLHNLSAAASDRVIGASKKVPPTYLTPENSIIPPTTIVPPPKQTSPNQTNQTIGETNE
jgi:hypothetical protein